MKQGGGRSINHSTNVLTSSTSEWTLPASSARAAGTVLKTLSVVICVRRSNPTAGRDGKQQSDCDLQAAAPDVAALSHCRTITAV